jgi:hypothetical protein
MRQLRLACCPLVICLGITSLPRGGLASQVIVTVTGAVQSGTNGNPDSTPPGAAKVFGGGPDLGGLPFSLTLVFDPSQGTNTFDSCPDGSVSQSSNTALGATKGPTAVLEIGAGSFSFGTLPLGGISWTILRSAPASCTSPYSEIGFGWSESVDDEPRCSSVSIIKVIK